MRKVKVKVTLLVDVEFSDDATDEQIKFIVEENGCPGTNVVGSAIEAAMAENDARSTCWGCALHGENEVVSLGEPA